MRDIGAAQDSGVLHVITGLNTGGAEIALCRLLESIRAVELNHSVLVLGREGALSERVRAACSRLIHLNLSPRRVNPLLPITLRKLVHVLRPQVVHGWMYHGNLAASLATIGRKVPVLWGIRHSLHDYAEEKGSVRAVIKMCAWLSNQPAGIIYNSHVASSQHEARGYSVRKTRVIPNGFDTALFRPDLEARARIRGEMGIAAGDFVIGHVARWHPVKDHGTLLRAAASFLKTRPDTLFLLVGEGVDRENHALVSLTRGLQIENNVRLCGRRIDIAAMNAAFDIASCSSSGEAFPNAVGEAMACGVPCAATDVGEMRELIGETGVLVPPRDPEALCGGWSRLSDMGLVARRALGEQARKRIMERYSLVSCARAYEALYEELGVSAECAV